MIDSFAAEKHLHKRLEKDRVDPSREFFRFDSPGDASLFAWNCYVQLSETRGGSIFLDPAFYTYMLSKGELDEEIVMETWE